MALTYTDQNKKTVLRAEGRFQAVVSEAVKAGDLLNFLNTGTANAVQLADQSTSVAAQAIAIDDGVAGELIWCAETVELKAPYTYGTGGIITQTNFAAAADFLGSTLYLGESGKPSSSVGSTYGQQVGYMLDRDRIVLSVKAVVQELGDGVGIVMGASQDSQVLYDGTNDEWTVQTKDAAGALQDVIAVGLEGSISFGGGNVDGTAFALVNTIKRTMITSVGAQLHMAAQSTTFDNGSGTVAVGSPVFIGIQTWLGDTATLTVTQPAALYIEGVPVASTNVTFTNPALAIWVDAGEVRFDGKLTSSGGGALTGTWTNLGIVTTVDINGGTVDGVVIGGASAGAITGTTIDATTDFTIGATVITDGILTDAGGFRIAASLDMNNNAISNIGAAGIDISATGAQISAANVGSDMEVRLTNTDNSNSNSDARIIAVIGGSGAGIATAEMRISGVANWAVGVSNGASGGFAIANDTGLNGAADAIRIGTDEVVAFNAAQGSDFDYWCSGCGKTRFESFLCCDEVKWHDDNLALVKMNRSREGLEHMAEIGVMNIGRNNDDTEWLGINMQTAIQFTWSAMGQSYKRQEWLGEVVMAHEMRFSTVEDRVESVEEALEIVRAQVVSLGTRPEA
jgi:hypothetical protein